MGTAVELRGVSKRYGVRRPWVLREVSLAVNGGTIVELAGVNGAGKSTLLRILAGATLPTAGRRHAALGLALGYMPERLTARASAPARARPWCSATIASDRGVTRSGGWC
jgi:ABC-type Mn2+/Zn2+ transport system ATPase subunit